MIKDNCPHCGAAITTEKCPYCGTLFYDFAVIDTDKPFYIKIKNGNRINRCKVKLHGLHFQMLNDTSVFYADNGPHYIKCDPKTEITINFRVLEDNGIIGTTVNLDEIDPGVQAW